MYIYRVHFENFNDLLFLIRMIYVYTFVLLATSGLHRVDKSKMTVKESVELRKTTP